MVNGFDPVVGYLELGMAQDALLELEQMADEKKASERYQELVLAAQMMMKQWKLAAETAQRLIIVQPQKGLYFIHAAFCLHETGETKAALHCLLNGPTSLGKNPLYHYNLACYYAVLGETDSAQHSLSEALILDPSLLESARTDSDLDSIAIPENTA